MSAEIIKEVKERQQKALWMLDAEKNMRPETLTALIDLFEYYPKALEGITKLSQMDMLATFNVEAKNKSMAELERTFNIDRCFNPKEALERLRKGYLLIIGEGYSFNGMYFEKGGKKIYKNL